MQSTLFNKRYHNFISSALILQDKQILNETFPNLNQDCVSEINLLSKITLNKLKQCNDIEKETYVLKEFIFNIKC